MPGHTLKYAMLKPSKKGVHKVTDISQEGYCLQTLVFRLQVIDKQELANDTFEFTFKAGRTTMRGISFGQNGGPANNNLLQVGNTYEVRGLCKQIQICLRNKQQYKQPAFTSKYELRLPELEVLSQKVNRLSTDARSKLNSIIQLNELIQSGGKFSRECNLTNVTIQHCEFWRYKGCHACKTRIQDPIHSNKRLLCPKCQRKGGDKREDGKWKMFMTLKDFRFQDNDGNTFKGGIAFHEECEKIFVNFSENCDQMFDEKAKEVAKKNLVGAKVNVSIKIKSETYRVPGTRSTDLKIIVCRLKVLSPPPEPENGVQMENEPQPSTSNSNDGDSAPKSQDCEATDEEAAREVDCHTTDNSNSTKTIAAFDQDHTVLTESGTESVCFGQQYRPPYQPDTPRQSVAETSTALSIYSLFPDVDELEKAANFDEMSQLNRCGAMILYIYSTYGYEPRLGSEKDVANLQHLLTEILDTKYYLTFLDVESSDLAGHLESFENFLKQENADSMMLFFSCHGMQNSIIMSDGVPVNIYTNILARYSDDVFPHLAGKPKMFFLLGCQEFDGTNNNGNSNGFLASDYSATLISLSQLSGNEVTRSEVDGTPFVRCFCELVRKYSDQYDVMKLLNRTSSYVQTGVKEIRKHTKWREELPNQVPQVQTIDFHVKYYFKKRCPDYSKLPFGMLDVENDNTTDRV